MDHPATVTTLAQCLVRLYSRSALAAARVGPLPELPAIMQFAERVAQ